MQTRKPAVTEEKIAAFLEKGAAGKAETARKSAKEKPQKKAVAAKTREQRVTKGHSRAVHHGKTAPVGSPPKEQKTIVKFLLELPAELRKAIKYRSIEENISMNDLIVAALRDRYGDD